MLTTNNWPIPTTRPFRSNAQELMSIELDDIWRLGKHFPIPNCIQKFCICFAHKSKLADRGDNGICCEPRANEAYGSEGEEEVV